MKKIVVIGVARRCARAALRSTRAWFSRDPAQAANGAGSRGPRPRGGGGAGRGGFGGGGAAAAAGPAR